MVYGDVLDDPMATSTVVVDPVQVEREKGAPCVTEQSSATCISERLCVYFLAREVR
jgi:hypothetical protein